MKKLLFIVLSLFLFWGCDDYFALIEKEKKEKVEEPVVRQLAKAEITNYSLFYAANSPAKTTQLTDETNLIRFLYGVGENGTPEQIIFKDLADNVLNFYCHSVEYFYDLNSRYAVICFQSEVYRENHYAYLISKDTGKMNLLEYLQEMDSEYRREVAEFIASEKYLYYINKRGRDFPYKIVRISFKDLATEVFEFQNECTPEIVGLDKINDILFVVCSSCKDATFLLSDGSYKKVETVFENSKILPLVFIEDKFLFIEDHYDDTPNQVKALTFEGGEPSWSDYYTLDSSMEGKNISNYDSKVHSYFNALKGDNCYFLMDHLFQLFEIDENTQTISYRNNILENSIRETYLSYHYGNNIILSALQTDNTYALLDYNYMTNTKVEYNLDDYDVHYVQMVGDTLYFSGLDYATTHRVVGKLKAQEVTILEELDFGGERIELVQIKEDL